MKKNTYDLLVNKMHEVSSLPQQTMGPFTPLYRTLVPHVKEAPWRWFAAGSFATGVALYFLLGATIVKIVSVLQHGF